MARKVEVEIIGDSRKLERAFQRSAKAAKDFNRNVTASGKTKGLFDGVSKRVAGLSAAFLGGAGVVSVLKDSVDAASNLSEQMSKTQKVFDDSADSVVDWSKTSATAMGLAQDQALETASSFGSLLRPLGLTGKQAADQSKQLTQLGADLASFYNTSVSDALDAVRSGIVGESEPLRKYGVLLSESRVQAEAMAETGKKTAKSLTNQEKATARITLIMKDAAIAQGDFADTSGGLANQQRILEAQIRNLEIAIGNQLKPVILEVVGAINDWLPKSENQKQVTDAVRGAVDLAVRVFKTLKSILEAINSVTGSTTNTLKLLFSAFVVFKGLKLAGTLSEMATSIGLIGTNAEKSTGKVRRLRGQLALLGKLGVITIGIDILFGGKPFGDGPGDGRYSGSAGWGHLFHDLSALAQGHFGDIGGKKPLRPEDFVAPSPEDIHPHGAPRAPKFGAPTPTTDKTKGFTRAQRNAFFDARIARILTRAQYKELQAQLADYIKVAALLTKRIATTKDITRKLKLEDQLLSVIAQQKDVREQLQQQALEALSFKVSKTAATQTLKDDLAANLKLQAYLKKLLKSDKDNLELQEQLFNVQQEIRNIRRQRQENRLFAALGLGPGGELRAPRVKDLRNLAKRIRKELEGALSPAQLRKLGRIDKILLDPLLKKFPEVRRQIKEILDAIYGTKGTARGITYVPPVAFAAAGARPRRTAGLYVAGNVNVYNSHNIGDLENQLTKRQSSRAHNRRGAR